MRISADHALLHAGKHVEKFPAAKSEEFPLDDTKITWFGLKNEDGRGKQAQSPSQQQRKKRKLLDLRIGYLSP